MTTISIKLFPPSEHNKQGRGHGRKLPQQAAAGNCKVEDAQSSMVIVMTAIAGDNEDIYQLRIFDYSCGLISSQTPQP